MKQLIDFLSAYEPKYAEVVKGASRDEIAALEAALGRRLPVAYRDFLETAAVNVGFDVGDVRFEVDHVLSLVTERHEPIPERFVPIAEDDGTTFEDYFLDMAHPAGDGDAMVVRVPAGGTIIRSQRPIFWSLRDMLFSWGFSAVRMLSLPATTELLWLPGEKEDVRQGTRLEDLGRVMTALGFDALTVTSPNAQLYERGDCAGSVYRVPFQSAFSLQIAARDDITALKVAETLRDALPNYSART